MQDPSIHSSLPPIPPLVARGGSSFLIRFAEGSSDNVQEVDYV